jgi:hypothetical protein
VLCGAVGTLGGIGTGIVAGGLCGLLANKLFEHYEDTLMAADDGYGCLRIRYRGNAGPGLLPVIVNIYNDGGENCRI